jgi:hypothetical protein
MEQLNTQLGSNVNRLVSADEFNEIIGALMNQLVGQVLGGGDGSGLSGVSRPSAGGGSSYLDQATDASQSGVSDAGISKTFTTTIENQRKYITQYQEGWDKIRTAAQAAANRCPTSGSPTPQDVLARSGSALAQAANAGAALDAIQTRIAAATDAGGNQTTTLLSISEDYNELISSDTLPSAEDIAEAQAESQDTGDEAQSSLYTRMTRLSSSSSCRSEAE